MSMQFASENVEIGKTKAKKSPFGIAEWAQMPYSRTNSRKIPQNVY